MPVEQRTWSWLGRAGDAATVAVAIAVVGLVVERYVGNRGPGDALASMSAALVDTDIGDALDVDFAAAERTAVVVVRRDCPACNESLPFYRRLTYREADGVKIVFAGPENEEDLRTYLASHGVEPDSVVSTGFSDRTPFSATPTLVVADGTGVVRHAWVGLLDAHAEGEVTSVLFGS